MVRIESMREGSDGGVPGVDIEIAGVLKRLPRSMLVIVGRECVDGKIVIDSSEIVVAFGRSLTSILVIVGRMNVVGRIVRDDGNSSSVVAGNKVAVKLSITDTTADKLVTVAMPDMLGTEATGIVFTIGFPSGPGCTARLANMTTV